MAPLPATSCTMREPLLVLKRELPAAPKPPRPTRSQYHQGFIKNRHERPRERSRSRAYPVPVEASLRHFRLSAAPETRAAGGLERRPRDEQRGLGVGPRESGGHCLANQPSLGTNLGALRFVIVYLCLVLGAQLRYDALHRRHAQLSGCGAPSWRRRNQGGTHSPSELRFP